MSLARHGRCVRLATGLGLALSLAGGGAARAAVSLEDHAQESASHSPDLSITKLTVGAGANHFLGLGVSIADAAVAVASAKWSGTPLVLLGTAALANAGSHPCHIEVWGLANPAPGPGVLNVTLTGFAAFGIGAASFAGVDAATPASGWASSTGTASPAGGSARPGQVVLESACIAGAWTGMMDPDAVAANASVSTTSLWDLTEPGLAAVGGLTAPGAAPRWVLTGRTSFAWISGGVALVAAGPALPDAGPDTGGGGKDGPLAPDTRVPLDMSVDTGAPPPPDAEVDVTSPPADTSVDEAVAPPDVPPEDLAPPEEDAAPGPPDGAPATDVGASDATLSTDVGGSGFIDGGPGDGAGLPADEGPEVLSSYRVGCACRLGDRTPQAPALAAAALMAVGAALRRRRR
jgi:MYXO-CTERM domain-containing protein